MVITHKIMLRIFTLLTQHKISMESLTLPVKKGRLREMEELAEGTQVEGGKGGLKNRLI